MEYNTTLSPNRFSVGSLISRTFSIFLANFAPFAFVVFLATLPEIVLQIAGLSEGGATLFGFFFKIIAEAVIVGMVYQHLRGQKVNISSAFSPALGRTLSLLGIRFFTGIAILGIVFIAVFSVIAVAASKSTMLIILAGIPIALVASVGVIVLNARWVISVPACVLEQLPALQSMGRSRDLTEGYRGTILLFISVLSILGIAFVMALVFIGAIFAGFLGSTDTLPDIMGSLAGGLFALLFWIAGAIMYYDLRAMKEGVDLEHLTNIFD